MAKKNECVLCDDFRAVINKRVDEAIELTRMTPEQKEEYYKKNAERLKALDKWLEENDHTGVDWDGPSTGPYTVGLTDFDEDEYDPSISEEEEEALIKDLEENAIDTGFITYEEFRRLTRNEMDDDEEEEIMDRNRKAATLCMEMFGAEDSDDMTKEQINQVRAILGVPPMEEE